MPKCFTFLTIFIPTFLLQRRAQIFKIQREARWENSSEIIKPVFFHESIYLHGILHD